MLDPVPTMTRLFEFLMGQNISGTVLEQRIINISGKGHKETQVYTLKEGAGRLYRNLDLYTEDQIEEIKSVCGQNLTFFEFAQSGEQAHNGTKYF